MNFTRRAYFIHIKIKNVKNVAISVVKHLPRIHKALGSNANNKKPKKYRYTL